MTSPVTAEEIDRLRHPVDGQLDLEGRPADEPPPPVVDLDHLDRKDEQR